MGNSGSRGTVELFNGNVSLGRITADETIGAYTITTELNEGDYSLTVKATDAAGNISEESDTLNLAVDTARDQPTITTTTSLTNNATPTIEGTAEVSTVELFNGEKEWNNNSR